MKIEPIESPHAVKEVVGSCGLPTADLHTLSHARFFGASDQNALVAVIGLEVFSEFGLLRSLAVLPDYREEGLAGRLVAHVETVSKQRGIEQLYLLTETAENYFLQRGYVPTSRDAAPPAIRSTSQFTGLCPATAAFLAKRLGA